MRTLSLLGGIAALFLCAGMILEVSASDRHGRKRVDSCSTATNTNASCSAGTCSQPQKVVTQAPTTTAAPTACKDCKCNESGKTTEFKTLKVTERLEVGDGIYMTAYKGTTGIWLSNEKVKGMIGIYVTEGQGPVVGIHHNKDLSGRTKGDYGFDLALALNKDEPSIQFRKTDGSFGWITAKELEAAIKK